jgi:hypothetical protein
LQQGPPDHIYNRFNVLQDIVVPKPEDAKPMSLQPSCAFRIRDDLSGVLASVNLYDQSFLQTDEICDVWTQ